MTMTVYSLPESAKRVIHEFSNLPLGGFNVVCPYHINPKSQRAGLRVLIGKGDPGEITREVKVLAQLKGLDLAKTNPDLIRKFMVDNHVGIDCSGFIVHVLNYWLRMQGDRPLIKYLKFPTSDPLNRLKRILRPIEQIGANLLTGELNADKITDLNLLRPGDLLRSKGLRKNAHHISLVSEVTLVDGIVREIEYVHSISGYEEENGVRFGKILVVDPKLDLSRQTWTELKNGRNWTYEGLMKEFEDNGFRRLKNVRLACVST